MIVLVSLPNGTNYAITCDPKAIGQTCLEKVCQNLDIICETEYFGLVEHKPTTGSISSTGVGTTVPLSTSSNASSSSSSILQHGANNHHHQLLQSSAASTSSSTILQSNNSNKSLSGMPTNNYEWINLRNPLPQHSTAGQGGNLQLELRVKFWVPPHLILQENVRNIFYLQARSDLLNGTLKPTNWANAVQLAALMAQADKLTFNPDSISCSNLMPTSLFVNSSSSSIISSNSSSNSSSSNSNSTISPNESVLISGKCKKRRLSRTKSITSAILPNTLQSILADDSGIVKRRTELTNVPTLLSPLTVYQQYFMQPEIITTTTTTTTLTDGSEHDLNTIPNGILQNIAKEHGKLVNLKMSSSSAKYWLLEAISKLNGFGEEIFTGRLINEPDVRCDVNIGPHGILITKGDTTINVPFSAASSATPNKNTFTLTYITEQGDTEEFKVKLPRQKLAAALYRSITEKHAFYSCETVCVDVTKQFVRDLKGTIISLFNVDTKLGIFYVFDIQRTCREVHDNARRVLHTLGIKINQPYQSSEHFSNELENWLRQPPSIAIDDSCQDETYSGLATASGGDLGKTQLTRTASIETEVTNRIAEAFTCRVCMDEQIDTVFSPCGHVACCEICAEKCNSICPLCRAEIITVNKVYLPTAVISTNSIKCPTTTTASTTATITPPLKSSIIVTPI